MDKTLSVCIVLFNRWELSKKSILSIVETVPRDWNLKWSIIDNGSSDETQEQVEDFVYGLRGEVEFLQVLREALKQTQAVNRTMNPATGKYMLRVDNDIDFKQGWFEDCLAIINDPKFKDLGFVCPTHHLREAHKGYKPHLVLGTDSNTRIDMVSDIAMTVPGNIFGLTSVIKDIGGFYTPYNLLHADVHYCQIAKHMGYKFGYTWDSQCPHIGQPDGKTEYSQKAINERRSEDARYTSIAKGNVNNVHPQEVEFAQQLIKMMRSAGKELPQHKGMNVLIPSSGRRVELVEMFKRTFEIPRWEGKVFTCGCDDHMSTAYVSDGHVMVPPIKDESYIDTLIKVCQDYDIKYIFPVIDYDVKFLSENKTRFLREAGTEVVTPDYENAMKCFDKEKTAMLFSELGIPHPQTTSENISNNKSAGIYIQKPRYGFASKEITTIELGDNDIWNGDTSKYVLQEKIKGVEYTVDCVSDRRFDIISLVTRERIATRGGEIQHGKVVNQLHLFPYLGAISRKLELVGPWCAQYFIDEEGKPWFIEVNTRFGGGVPISDRAGQNQALIAMKVLERDFFGYHYRYLVEWGLEVMRFDRAIYRHISTGMVDHDTNGKSRLKG